ncbi:MAG: hypothetical protein E7059_02435 [Treponema bryantii]|nr:hypothetical protein [Treponema bryantii]
MNQENIIEKLTNHIFNGQCGLCTLMKWNKNCPWKVMSDMTSEEADEFEAQNKNIISDFEAGCKDILKNKLSTNIKIEGQKIECTEEGAKFLTSFFADLKSFVIK